MEYNLSSVMVIFGGTGDLTKRKLLPAIYNLHSEKSLSKEFAVVAVGRRDKSSEEFRREMKMAVSKFSRIELKEELWQQIEDRIYYYQLDFQQNNGYEGLNKFLDEVDQTYHTKGNRLFYLAVAPEYFAPIANCLHQANMVINKDSWQRVVIEKPFGRDLETAELLNKTVTDIFEEKNTYRIDHYLGKEMLQNIMVIRFANTFFDPLWNNHYIDNVQITASETVGVEERGGYYEKAGALRDMVQNHMLQLLTLIAMEPPVRLETEAIRDEKVKVLRSLKEFTPDVIKENVVRGQYTSGITEEKKLLGYREEERVAKDSETETYVSMKVEVENFRWAGVPFYIRTGKRMPKKETEIVIQFKDLPNILYFKEYENLRPNLLRIKVNPREGINFQINAKTPGTVNQIRTVEMDYCQNCMTGNNSPEAYERLLLDVMKGDATLFTRWDEVEYSWKFVENIQREWDQHDNHVPSYAANTWGPIEGEELLKRDNRQWWE